MNVRFCFATQAWTPNYEATKLEAERADLILKEDEAIEQLRGDLAALEDRIRQAAVQAGSERVSSCSEQTDRLGG